MSERRATKSLLRRLWDVLRGADTVFGESVPEPPDAAGLRQELERRDERIAALEASAARLEQEVRKAGEAARAAATLRLLQSVAAPLSQLATLRGLAAAGTRPDVADVLRLTDTLQKAFETAGLQSIGSFGDQVPFSPQLHKPLGLEQFREGELVTIRFVGFRLGDQIIRQALVASSEG